ncbi:bifunctional metallophosphatase/5'-nucleotidase [Azospirillum rugosum]|uniref:2',3'-cyclic-nucleotide 2'-phosphodiesterase (5'-nucleotidase family) n=1 Tax=Azospirillum rugosum TaxID=416170 RepID=A0ABS4SI72_9PROT|nr:5'-nucleotidase C-terminal domain-containing protein [Azospirillum rugosum]MBP2291637.1 2',3'-cyclic-nucleotide 2'-phosphodiesterase (5'-nucleotidase family) [Azospirillum rugosum]MDQ0524551.1 2',3'-cyclic-nucleotide 2'-phosphodiesterase (5'-nucleotidase family) [Azospirillum rugosum]
MLPVLALALAGLATPLASALAEPFRFTLLYAHSTTELEDTQGRGGIARLATVVRQERAAHDTVLVLHGGQSLAPSVLSFYDQGAHVIDLLNGLGIDAMAALNREFHHGDDTLMTRAFAANFPLVTTNAVDRATGKPLDGLESAVVLDAGPYKVGVLAATPTQTKETTRSGRTEFRDPAGAVADKARELRAQGVDLVVAMTANSGNTHRDVIAARAANIVLYQDRGRAVGVEYDGKSLAATVDAQAAWVLALDITIERGAIDRNAKTGPSGVAWSAGVRAIDTAPIPPDSAVDSRAKAYLARLDGMLGMQVGRLESPVDTRREAVRGGENAFANALADALRAAMEADVALVNGGTIRGDRQYAAGTLWTRRDIQTEIPYHDTAVLLEVTGQQLRDALESGYSGIEQAQGRFPHLSNARVLVDASRPAGRRIVELTVGGKPVEPAARYRLATGSYIAQGSDGYTALAAAPRLVDDRDADFLSTILADQIARTGSFAPRLDGRLTVTR